MNLYLRILQTVLLLSITNNQYSRNESITRTVVLNVWAFIESTRHRSNEVLDFLLFDAFLFIPNSLLQYIESSWREKIPVLAVDPSPDNVSHMLNWRQVRRRCRPKKNLDIELRLKGVEWVQQNVSLHIVLLKFSTMGELWQDNR